MPEIEWTEVLSGNVGAVGYNDGTKELYVRYIPNGRVYTYSGVPADIAQECARSWSVKTFLTTEIFGRYPVRRVS